MQLQQSAVKKYALSIDIPVLQPEKLKNPDFLEVLKSYEADIQVVVAFRMLPEVVWNMPPMGTINLHGSLLPQYRGAAPINWAIINGETETGVTTFKLQQEIDTGNILLQKSIVIAEDETAGELHDVMKEVGAQLLVRTIEGLAKSTLQEQPQERTGNEQQAIGNGEYGTNLTLKHAPKLFTETCKIDWSKDTIAVYNLIRGLSPFPGAFTYLNGKQLKIFTSQKEIKTHSLEAGSYQTDGKTFLKFACADGFISVIDIQPEGKRRMKAEEFLRGFRG